MSKKWIIQTAWRNRAELARELGVSEIIAQILHNRDMADAQAARHFLKPQMADILPPEDLPNCTQAAERIMQAARDGKKIVVFGDYDVDGITASAMLWHCLTLANANVDFYIPHRLEEGYGIGVNAIETLAADGANLIITVDCGVTALEAAARAKALNVELIITDHHSPRLDADENPILPDAMVVHPGLDKDSYPNPHLSGAGVAFKLAWAIGQQLSNATKVSPQFREFLVNAMGLAALGLIADVVPLTGENRIIAHHGLRGLPQSTNPGIQALIESADLKEKKLSGYDVGFKLAPRLNAIGRMGHARLAVEMFTRAAPDEALQIARHLEEQNKARQTLQRKIAKEASELVVEQGQDADTCRGIVLASPHWHAGIVGIVASRIVETYHRPAVLIALEDGQGQGSGRSIKHFPLNRVFDDCKDHLLTYGGHAMAAGLRIETGQVDAFRDAFQARAAQLLTPTDLLPKLHIDDVVQLPQLTEALIRELTQLEPCGAGNPRVRLASDWLEVIGEPRTVGVGDSHLQVVLGDGQVQIKGIAFGLAKMLTPLLDHRKCQVAFEPMLNQWRDRRTVEMQILDFKFPGED